MTNAKNNRLGRRTRGQQVIGLALVFAWSLALLPGDAMAQVPIHRLCDVKGQESLTLRGVGLVVGLAGTGDPELPATFRALGKMLSGSGLEVMKDLNGQEMITEFRGTKNAALVFISAEVPGEGMRQGTKIRCRVDSFGTASSLQGGMLLESALTAGPFVGDSGRMPILATASGPIRLPDTQDTTSGLIDGGCQLQVDIENRFTYEHEVVPAVPSLGFDPLNPQANPADLPRETRTQLCFDLVIRPNHAGFGTAAEIVETISRYQLFEGADVLPRAKDQVTVQVPILGQYADDPVKFVREIMDLELPSKPKSSVVVISRKQGIVIIGEEVRFDPAAVSSGEFVIDANPVRALDLEGTGIVDTGPGVELKKLQQALNQLQATPESLIEIITGLERGGYLYGSVVEID